MQQAIIERVVSRMQQAIIDLGRVVGDRNTNPVKVRTCLIYDTKFQFLVSSMFEARMNKFKKPI
jgi:hypothetical protein